MDTDDPTPSPKRRRTSSHGSAYSSRNSSPEPEGTSNGHNRSPNHILPLRRADTSQLKGGRYSEPRSRDDSFDRDDGDSYNRPAGNQRRRSRSRTSDSSTQSARSRSRTRSPASSHGSQSRSYSPADEVPPPQQKRLRFRPLFTISKAHARGVTSVKFSPDGTLLATSSADATINVYAVPATLSPSSTAPFKHLKTLRGHLAGINALAWSPLPPYTLASASDDKSILLWTPSSSDTPISPSPLTGHSNYVYSLAFSPKGNMLVSGSYDEAVFLWDIRSARVMRSLPAHSDPVGGVDFLRDGTMVASCATDGLIRIWDAGTGQCLRTLVDEDRRPVTAVRFTPNGRFVVAWTLDHCIRLWRYVEGTCVKTYQGHVNRQYSLGGMVGDYLDGTAAFLVSGSEDGAVLAWDVTTKEVLWRGHGHGAAVLDVDFCRLNAGKGRGLLVSGGLDRDVRVWIEELENEDEDEQDVAAGREIEEEEAENPRLASLADAIKREEETEEEALVNGHAAVSPAAGTTVLAEQDGREGENVLEAMDETEG